MKAVFKMEKTVNAILYALTQMGGSGDIHRIFGILYFADRDHLSRWGRLITGDVYVAMKEGPVPSRIYDIFQYLSGDSNSDINKGIRESLRMINERTVERLTEPDMESLSGSDIQCLDRSIGICSAKSSSELKDVSQGQAWGKTPFGNTISYGDMLREIGDTEDYISYIEEQLRLELAVAGWSA